MSFFKRKSRGSRANSYAEDDYDRPRSQGDTKFTQHESPRQSTQSTAQHNSFAPAGIVPGSPTKETNRDMYRSHAPQEPYAQRGIASNGVNSRQNSGAFEASPLGKVEQTPDLLTRAFNEAIRPYNDKIDQLEAQLAELQSWVDQLEQQKSEMYSWIDKRGLRPGMIEALPMQAPKLIYA